MTPSHLRQALFSAVVSRCEPRCLPVPVLVNASLIRFAQSRPIPLIIITRQLRPHPCRDLHQRKEYLFGHTRSFSKRCRPPPTGSFSSCRRPAARGNFAHPSTPVISPSNAVAAPHSAQTLAPHWIRACGPPLLWPAAKDSSPPPRGSSWHHPSPACPHSVYLIHTVAPRSSPRLSTIRLRTGLRPCPPATRRSHR